MKNLKHTPGPWEILDNGGMLEKVGIANPDKSNWFIAEEILPDDARLIAAAPEMLGALIKTISVMCHCCNTTTSCEVFQSYNNRKCDQYEVCKAAIEKATGLPVEEVMLCTMKKK